MKSIQTMPTIMARKEVVSDSNQIGCIINKNGIKYQVGYIPPELNITSFVATEEAKNLINQKSVKSPQVIGLLNKYKTSIVLERLSFYSQDKKVSNAVIAYLNMKGELEVLSCPRFEKRGRKPKTKVYIPGVIDNSFNPTNHAVYALDHLLDYGINEDGILSETIDR